LSVIFGLGAWGIALVGILLFALAFATKDTNVNPVILGLGVLIFLASPLAAVLGVGQAAAAIRTRGNHLILATAGLIVSGLNAGVILGLLTVALWQQ
jgi:hypothetical protein